MKKIGFFCTAILLALFFYGCLPSSLHPLYTDDTVVFDDQLLGKWYGEDGGSWSFTKSKDDDQAYTLRIVEPSGKQGLLDVHLVQLGQHHFIDLYPGENMDLENTAETYRMNMVSAHTFMKLQLNDPNLLLQWGCLNEVLEDDPNLLKHEKVEDSIVITAQPKDLQRVILDHLDKVVDSDDGGKFRRCPAAFPAKDITYEEKLVGQWKGPDDESCLDIMTWNDGYDILFENSDVQLHYKGLLYSMGGRNILGLYALPVAEKEAGQDAIPDMLVLVESVEPELKVALIQWQDFEAWLANPSEPLVKDSEEAGGGFQRMEP